MRNIGAAIIGSGFMSWVHVEALRRVGVKVLGVCGSSLEKSLAAAESLGLEKAYASFGEVLDDDRVASVHIGTPNRLHFAMAKQALEAGKHVMCEKPLAMTSDESADLVRTAAKHPNLAAAVNYNIRFYPLCVETRERIRQGAIGDVVHVTGGYVQDWLTFPTDYNWRVSAEENGPLRAVADIGTHWLDLLQHLTGLAVESVCADLLISHPVRQRPQGEVSTFQGSSGGESAKVDVPVTTEDYGAILLRFRNGVRGCLHVSQVTPGRKNCLRFEIAGRRQSIAWDSEQPNELWIGHRDQANQSLLRDPTLLAPASQAAADYPGGHNEGYSDSFKQCFRAYYDYIRRADFSAPLPFATFNDGHREVLLCEAVLESHRQQRWVAIEGE